MKTRQLAKFMAVGAAFIALMPLVSAQTVDCSGSLVPQVCNIFAGAGTFSVGGVLQLIFSIVIAVMVIFILFQIVKAVFEWVGKSNDDKARGAAIKSIQNAVLAGVVLLVAVLLVVVGAQILGINPPAAYKCYAKADVDVTKIDARGTFATTNQSVRELPNVTAQEGTGVNNYWASASKPTQLDSDVYAALKNTKCIVTTGSASGTEATATYITVSRFGLTKGK